MTPSSPTRDGLLELAAVERATRLIDFFRQQACPICSGDCAGANPPIAYCPMQEATEVLRALASEQER